MFCTKSTARSIAAATPTGENGRSESKEELKLDYIQEPILRVARDKLTAKLMMNYSNQKKPAICQHVQHKLLPRTISPERKTAVQPGSSPLSHAERLQTAPWHTLQTSFRLKQPPPVYPPEENTME